MHRSIIWLMIGAPVTLIIVAAGVAATVPKTIETQIAIKASPSKVWSILTDFSAIPSWNPFITAISGDVLPGSRLSVTIAPPGPIRNDVRTQRSGSHSGPGTSLAWYSRKPMDICRRALLLARSHVGWRNKPHSGRAVLWHTCSAHHARSDAGSD